MSPRTRSQTPSKPKTTKTQEIPKTWSRVSVRDFFSQINWEQDPEPIQQFKQASKQASLEGKESSKHLSLTLTVSQFFTCIDWEGQGAIAPSDPLPLDVESTSIQDEDDVTLEDFSSLF
ncbi:hypothetical protein PN466_13380 [Roseofilum reptotaenium CS-1145]|uniref:Uncharacterized protein n=1 Tax=Roseofilum reptotaenium AO1-A TaxID=1925591 RepID=A0A1L9QXQ9_9CYAN|nr:hypothetical protein [Roseofilum reptotaenium]MDB9517940.1 hypothetical protein [Roseofilum reptotaenium CS-1145]OJJ27426.1 hypothetical protein BI308_00135 [Roseofilum reptotaenium AO1-A]